VLQHGDDRLRGDFFTDPPTLARSSLSPSPISASSARTRKTSRPSDLAASAGARGAIFHAEIGEASNHRATRRLDDWLRARGIIGLTGVDTRALTAMIRETGMPNAVIAHAPDGQFDRAALVAQAKAWPA